MRPETLALRAVNQYRIRDVVPYLGLRYYLENRCALRDRWAEEVATHIVRTRKEPGYFKSFHFKELLPSGSIAHREVFLPGPNEAFAEAALLAECGKHEAFTSPRCVFSYRLAQGAESRGIYVPYFDGFRDRHTLIAAACRATPGTVVFYTDIKKFYPSISEKVAKDAWITACRESGVAGKWRDLGLKLLADHAETSRKHATGSGLLTGPMFSHLVANLVLRPIDDYMFDRFPGRYFRYVDDVVLVGTAEDVAEGRSMLADLLAKIDLRLHEPNQAKDFTVTAKEWLEGADDFRDRDGQLWTEFLGNLKRFLGTSSAADEALTTALSAAGFRIPIPVYKLATREAPWRLRLSTLLRKHRWLSKLLKSLSGSQIVDAAVLLRERYAQALRKQLELGSSIGGYSRKRAIPKIRFYAGRLLYLGTLDMLNEFRTQLEKYPELHLISEVLRAVSTRDVTKLLPLGGNAVQSAAQILTLDSEPVSCSVDNWTEECRQGLAILRFNDVVVDGPLDDPINRFAHWSTESRALMNPGTEPSIRELACLHGVTAESRHAQVLASVFDWDEALAFDFINQVVESGY